MEVNIYFDGPATEIDMGPREFSIIPATGPQGEKGDTGDKGDTGATGPGVAAGGTAGQVLVKASGTDYDTEWTDPNVSDDIKTALLQCFEKVAWIDGNGQQYYDALYEALYQVAPPAWRVLSADDIASSVGLSGLSIDGNGNIQWSDAILMSIIALSQNLKKVNYQIQSIIYPYSATIATIFVFKKESDSVFWGITGKTENNVRIPIPIKLTKSGNYYTYTDDVQYPMEYENFSSFGEEAEISAQLDNDVLTISNEYGARLTLSGANMLGWYINPNLSIELSGVRVSE